MVAGVEARLSREFSQIPVTALAPYSSPSGDVLVLAAEDTELKIYEVDSGRLVCQFSVFDEQPIHGIDVRQDGGGALVWGSKHLAVFRIGDVAEGRRPAVIRAVAPDWVYDGRLSPFDPSVAALATAHNEVVRIRIDHDAEGITVQGIVSPARPILYSAEMAWTDDNCILMVAGTAFGEILVWKCRLTSEPESPHEMLFVLTGHEGSIYGVNISPLLTLPDGNSTRLLATCSDDRTVRIWDVTERPDAKNTYDEGHFSAPRETGFSGILPDEEQPTMGATVPVAVAMGHLSRIWGVRFAAPQDGQITDAGISVYSFGEDSTTQRWRLSIDTSMSPGGSYPTQLTGTLTYEKTFSFHDGKHLWSHSISSLRGVRMIATGGADSRISLIEEPLSRPGPDPADYDGLLTFDIPDLCKEAPSQVQSKKSEGLGRFGFISQDQLVLVTSFGRLLLGNFAEVGAQWKRLQIDPSVEESLRRLYVLKRAVPGTAVLGTTNGGVYFYDGQNERLFHAATVPGKIIDIFCLNDDGKSGPPETLDLLVYMFGNVSPQNLVLDRVSGNVLSQGEVLGLDPRFVAVSASKVGQYLIMGSRHGFLSVLRCGKHEYTKILDHDLSSRDAFTSMIPLPSTSTSKPPNATRTQFLATSRDGKYRIYEIEDDGQAPQLHIRHDSALPFGPMIEGGWFTNDPSPELVLYGFRSKNFVVWNETRREERLSVDCGGGHRTTSLHHGGSDTEPLRFVFNRASKLSVFSQMKPRSWPLKKGTHGREIRALSSNGRYIATGAEDTSIRIWEYHSSDTNAGREMRCLASIKTHVTGIQTLKWLGEDYLFSSGGYEEFFVWRLRRLDAGHPGLGIVCEGVFGDKSPDGDLRIMDFDVRQDTGDGSIIITMVFSSSAFRSYRYDSTRGFQNLAKGAYTGSCLTQIRHLGPVGGDAWTVLTASTDGHICIWRTTRNERNERVFAIWQAVPVHQSSIKCLCMVPIEKSSYCVLTGGDDNALGLTMLTPDPATTTDFNVSSRGIVRRAHAAAVNGVIAQQQGDATGTGAIVAVTVSNDQRIKTWAVTKQDRAMGMKLVGDVNSGVADPGDVEFLAGGRRAMVGGVGVEVWNLG